MAQQEIVKLPEGWVDTPLDDIAKWGAGGTPKRSESSYYGGDIPWVKTGDLGPRRLKEASEHITELGVKNSSAKLFTKGSVAIAMYGATIGKTSILDFDATTNQACAVGQPIEDVTDSEFLYYLLKNEKQNFIDKGKGGAQPNISQQIIKAHTIGFPPLPEQKRIVEKLDSLLAQVDTIQQRLNNVPDIIKRFRQSVLAAAVSGKRTEQWRVKNEAENTRNDFGNLNEIEHKFEIPKNWLGVDLGSVSEKVSVGHVGKTTEFYTDEYNGIPFLRSQNVRQGYVSRKGLAYITEEFHQKLKKSQLKPGDLMVVRVGANRGDACVLGELFEEVNCANIVFARPDKRLSSYLDIYFQSPVVRSLLLGVSVGGAQGVINTKSVSQSFIALPPINEQTEIVHLVEQYFALADTLEKNLANAKQRVDNLTQSILAKAFKGELVPQDPNDEPADKLLDRIKAARLEAEKLEKVAKKVAKN